MNAKLYSLNITDLYDYSEKVIPITQEQKDILVFLSDGFYLNTEGYSFEIKDNTNINDTADIAAQYLRQYSNKEE